MPTKTPKFWYKQTANTQIGYMLLIILRPLSALYQLGHRTKLLLTKTHKAPLPVICIGNVTAGGSGKTPVCISLCELVKKHNLFTNPYFLTRGYGGNDPGPRRIKDHDTVQKVGDEPLLLASHSNTIISVNRPCGAQKAHDLGADIVIMDDGLQNPSLYKDLSFIVIDGTLGLGNKKTLPSGPLREPFAKALCRSNALIIIGEDTYGIKSLITDNIPIFEASIVPDINKQAIPINTNNPYIAFAGLGAPEKFFNTLRANNISLADTISFPDHHIYTAKDIKTIFERAKNSNAHLITTEKDYVRLPKEVQKQVHMYPVTIQWKDETSLVRFIEKTINNRNK